MLISLQEHFNPVLTNKNHILTVVADIESDERRYLASPCVVWMITRSFICPNLKQYDIKITRSYDCGAIFHLVYFTIIEIIRPTQVPFFLEDRPFQMLIYLP